MGMIDLRTREGATLFCDRKREEMRRMFDHKGRFEVSGYGMCAYAFMTHAIEAPRERRAELADWRTGEKLPCVCAQLITIPFEARPFLSPATLAPLFGETIRTYCRLGRAVGVVTMHEMWWRSTELDASQSIAENMARARAEVTPTEVLYLRLEHQHAGVRAWRAIITRPERGPAHVEPWRQLDGVLRMGNFDNLLDLKEMAPS